MMGKDKGQSDTRKVGDVCVFFCLVGGAMMRIYFRLAVIVCYSYSLFA